jgi:hypothetical protein
VTVRAGRTICLALRGFTLLTVAVFRPTPAELTHTIPAERGRAADAVLLMWATSHVSRALLGDPRHLFEAGIFHPAHLTLACGDHMIGQAVLGLPLWLATGNPVLEYNVLSLASYALGATAMFAYVRLGIGLGWVAAAAAGIAFAFTPFRFHSPLWLQLLWTPFVPLALLGWLRFVRTERWRDWALWVGCWAAHSLMGLYLAFYFGVVMAALAAFGLVAAPTRRGRRFRVGTLLAPVAVGAALLPTLMPYVLLRARQGNVRTFGLDTAASFILPAPDTLSGALTGIGAAEQLGPGLVVAGLLILGLVVRPAAATHAPLPAAFLRRVQVLGLAVSLALVFVPIHLQHLVPGFDMVRSTNRALLVGFAFAGVLVALAVQWLRERAPTSLGAATCVALLALLLADMGTPPRTRMELPVGDALPEPVAWLAALPSGTPVYEQVHGAEGLSRAMYHAIFHRQPMPTGYSGFSTPAGSYLNHALFRYPDPASQRLLRGLGVRFVWKRFRNAAAADTFLASPAAAGLEVAARFPHDVILAVGDPPGDAAGSPARPLAPAAWTLGSEQNAADVPLLRDGDDATAWRSRAAPGEVPALTVDLTTARTVVAVRTRARRDLLLGTVLMRVETSDDGEHWDHAADLFEPTDLERFVHAPPEVVAFEARLPPRPVRHVRIVNQQISLWRSMAAQLAASPKAAALDLDAADRALDWEITELDVLVAGGP